MISIEKDKAWCLIAPDGTPQPYTIAEDFVTCISFIKMLHKAGLGKSWHEMRIKGFDIQEIELTIKPLTK